MVKHRGWSNDYLRYDDNWGSSGSSSSLTHQGQPDHAQAISHLSDKVHQISYLIEEIDHLSSQVERAESTGVTLEQCEQKVERMKVARDDVRLLLKRFVESMKSAEKQGLFKKNTSSYRQFKKIQESFLRNQSKSQSILEKSMVTEKELLTRKMSLLSEREQALEDEELDDFMDSRGEQARVKQQLSLSKYDANNIETEKAITKEKLKDLKLLESELDDVAQCYVNFRDIAKEQQIFIDNIQDNVDEANHHVDGTVDNLKEANLTDSNNKRTIFFLILIVLGVFCLCLAAIILMVVL
mmetsp:Transcript_14285/g.21595  ORF Transcript_14285/g.21595 Transcript_14285/m.21595 type:complete len:297 (+) Transcript_14285:140-1030(+)|eukprot:CAMPEP_0117426260 /NCGR_PEP_ID=MMETSP0758-20121206/6416_1 /TAXON_ID=63605 /ORGANISM="Percolomonas cosmopolitus, Strain AE-1 (ATCC 50343)" /LENGTH=296 /DNA_ID=CAMNT_0005211335 /DNA_START=37 /DNA_END=927 /DNA_ORIENTATION=+